MKQIEDFLFPSIIEIKHSIKGIDASYNNEWDIIAELSQNAVDAIKMSSVEEGKIDIIVNCQEKSIFIKDNGLGISPNNLPYLLKPFATDKTEDNISIGEKGVGITFAMFSCNYFKIKSGNYKGVAILEVRDAYNWKTSSDESNLNNRYEKIKEDFSGTEVLLKKVKDCTLFELTFKQFKYVLRTRTAIGNTNVIWDDDKKIKISLNFIDQNGKKDEEDIPFKYWLIFDEVDRNELINLDDFKNFAESADRTDRAKRAKLKDKIIYKIGKCLHNNRTIKYVTCFVPRRSNWGDISIKTHLATEENLNEEEWESRFGYARFQNGIFTSVKGMPTGINISHPGTGYSGYWSNIFMLFEDRDLKFDIGRKSIHGSQANIYRKYAKDLFNEYLKYVSRYVSGDIAIDSEWDKDLVFNEIESIMDLEVEDLKFKKNPRKQEASVMAIFFECIGNGKIDGIIPLLAGYRGRYDLYALCNQKRTVIEFKSKLRNILRDFDDEQKMFDEIDCIVCWDVDEEDINSMHVRSISLEEVIPSTLVDNRNIIPNTTHSLSLSIGANPIYIIDLKKVIFGE